MYKSRPHRLSFLFTDAITRLMKLQSIGLSQDTIPVLILTALAMKIVWCFQPIKLFQIKFNHSFFLAYMFSCIHESRQKLRILSQSM